MMRKKTVVTETKEININKRPVSNHAILNILDLQQTQEKLANSDSNKAVHTLCFNLCYSQYTLRLTYVIHNIP